ncbi:MAG: antitoxin VbhA family protein [Oscillospiraceae bacterium]|nr:antitoxin VbhA family protein [Oscillospiraceae bacterium]
MERKISTEQALKNAAASVRMEGFDPSERSMRLCKDVLDGKMSFDEYLAFLKKRAGV